MDVKYHRIFLPKQKTQNVKSMMPNDVDFILKDRLFDMTYVLRYLLANRHNISPLPFHAAEGIAFDNG